MTILRRLLLLSLLALVPLATSTQPRAISSAASSIWGTNRPINAAVLVNDTLLIPLQSGTYTRKVRSSITYLALR